MKKYSFSFSTEPNKKFFFIFFTFVLSTFLASYVVTIVNVLHCYAINLVYACSLLSCIIPGFNLRPKIKAKTIARGNNLLNMFNVNKKTNNAGIAKVKNTDNNCAGIAKHYPPANKEWLNSIYAYNHSTVKILPSHDKVISKLMKSYFNLYSRKLENKVRSSRLRMRARRLSTNRMLISKAELKHTADRVIVTIYVYNQEKKFYLNKLDQLDKSNYLKANQHLLSEIKINKIKNNSLKVAFKVKNQKKRLLTSLSRAIENKKVIANNIVYANNFIGYDKKYLRDYVSIVLRKEIFSIFYKQLISFNKSKFDKRYLLPITNLVSRVYKKKVEFNLVNLKYLYLNSHIFSETLVTKLKNRNNSLLGVLNTSLLMFSLPPLDGLAIYNEIYNRKMTVQSLKIEDFANGSSNVKAKTSTLNTDILEQLLLKLYSGNPANLVDLDDYDPTLNSTFNLMKHKFVSGIRLEVAGRLTRRNTAARSVYKLKYKGNIRNMDSSDKGLSTVMLRSHAKSNLEYTFLKSKIRIGSFGLKGWVSSS